MATEGKFDFSYLCAGAYLIAAFRLERYQMADDHRRPTLTTTAGAPIPDNQNSITAGPRGPVLLDDFVLIEKLPMQNRERVPERVLAAQGSGASGKLLESCYGVDD